jgi:diaminohydroxyphosphoribosylaminopyrimidine deaminase/5-amino-6-(5-phosphoribosylamino)uracil reductase
VRVVLDRRLRLPPSARLFEVPGDVLIYTEARAEEARGLAESKRALEERGAAVVPLPEVTPAAVLADLYGRGIRSLLVEGGAGVAAAFVEAGLFDRVGVDVAPLLIGGQRAPGPLAGGGFATLDEAPRLTGLRVERHGGDVILKGYRERCLPDLYASVEA